VQGWSAADRYSLIASRTVKCKAHAGGKPVCLTQAVRHRVGHLRTKKNTALPWWPRAPHSEHWPVINGVSEFCAIVPRHLIRRPLKRTRTAGPSWAAAALIVVPHSNRVRELVAKASFEVASVLEAVVMFVFAPFMFTPPRRTRFAEAVIIPSVATRAIPISAIEASIVEPRGYPVSAGIGWQRPVTVSPAAIAITVFVNPNISRARTRRAINGHCYGSATHRGRSIVTWRSELHTVRKPRLGEERPPATSISAVNFAFILRTASLCTSIGATGGPNVTH
jgi:hypothetical protein